MTKRSLPVAAILILFVTFAAGYAREPGEPKHTRITAFIPSDESCGAFIAAERATGSENRQWLSGYLTAYNAYSSGDGDVTSTTDWQGVIEWLKSLCSSDPLLDFHSAVIRLLQELERRKAR